MDRDISKQTINVLFVLAILVMLLGTFTVYLEASNLEVVEGEQPTQSSTGQASINVPAEPQESTQSGELTLTIVE